MRRIPVDVELTEEIGDYNNTVPAVEVTCTRCTYTETAYGRGPASIRRACLKLREGCPNEEHNFYIYEGDGDDSYEAY